MYHYLITVGINDVKSSEPGKLYVRDMLEYTETDRKNVEDASMLANDDLFKTPIEHSSKQYDCQTILASLQAMVLRNKIHNTIMLHYTSKDHLDREWFESWVSITPLEELKKAQVR